MNKELKKLFFVLAFYSFSAGLYYNFQDFWLQDNNLTVKSVSNVLSLCSFIAVGVIFLCTNLLTKRKIKKFALLMIVLKTIMIFILFLLNGTDLKFLIKFITIIEYALDVELWSCLYPMMSIIKVSDKTYALRDIIYSATFYLGVFFAGFLLSKRFFGYVISYNFYPLIAICLMIAAFITLKGVNLEKYLDNKIEKNVISEELVLIKLIKLIVKDKISIFYLLYVLFNKIAYSTVMIMVIMLMKNWLGVSETLGTNLNLIFGILSSIVASIVLYYFTFKNDNINLFIKFGLRIIFYILAFVLNKNFMYFIAIYYALITSQSYSHVSDAPFINRFHNDNQIAFCNFTEMINYLGTSIGAYFCGIAIVKGINYIFLIATFFAVIGYIFAIYGLKLRKKVTK